jgi:hypothetical protein
MTSSINDPSALINQLPVSIELPRDPAQFIESMTILYKRIAQTVNTKEGGLFSQQEFMSNQQYNIGSSSSFRTVYRKTVNFGALPAAGTKSVAHGITGITPLPTNFSFTHIYAAATDQATPSFIPIPYASPVLANNIEINADATNVNITVGSNRSNYTLCYVVLEYLKN